MSEDKKLFVPRHANMLRAHDGEKYRPSNGTEGEMFREMYCYQCSKDDGEKKLCDILGRTLGLLVDDPDYPTEWQYNGNGQPVCTAFKKESESCKS